MNNTIVYAHPYDKSFNSAILENVIQCISKHGEDYSLLDLYKDNFDPVMSSEDLRLYMKGKTKDPLIEEYNRILDDTDRIIFIFPIWWYDMPAILRGFFDKVLLSGSAYTEDEQGMHPVRAIDKTFLFTTSSAPTEAFIKDYNDPINGTVIGNTFKCVGFNNAKWLNQGLVSAVPDEDRQNFLNSIEKHIY